MKDVRYFAFGSNMLTHRLLARVDSARLVGPVRASGWRLAFHKRGADGSGKCDLCPSHPGESVVGVLFELDAAGLQELDVFEGPGYRREPIRLRHEDEWILAMTYRAEPSHQDTGLRPFGWYRQLVIAGLIEHGAGADEIARIRETAWVPDSDPERPARLQALAALSAFRACRPGVDRLLPEHERA